MRFFALMSALLVSRVWTLDCDPSNFYPNGNNEYPNTYYCTDERGTWENGRYFGACRRDGTVESCNCVTEDKGWGLCKCVNFFDKKPNGCYSTSRQCSKCPNPGEGRVGCGCDKENNKCHDGPTCRKCLPDEYAKDQTTCTVCRSECNSKDMYISSPCTSTANAVCSICIAGRYCNDGKTATVCPENHYCPYDSSAPIPCVAPRYCKGLGLSYFSVGCNEAFRYDETGCFACERGSVLISSTVPHMIKQCTQCTPGTYAIGNKCEACPAGTFSPTSSRTQCDDCLAGSYASTGATACTQCEPGFFTSNSRASTCIACDAGKYSSSKGASICNTCNGGTYSVSHACVQCDAGKTTFTQDMKAKDGASSANECRSCPNGTFACTACPYTSDTFKDLQCENEKCNFGDYQVSTTYVPCVPCGANSTHYCANGRRILRAQPVNRSTFNLRPARDGSEDNIIMPCTVCGAGTYAFVRCTPTTDTVCRKCSNPRWLIERISRNCTPLSDTVLVACNQTELATVGGACNPCPPGSTFNASRCALYQPQCPPGTVSGLGSRRCTVRCPQAGQVAPDGITCGKLQTKAINANNAVSFDSVAYCGSSFIGVQNFMMVGRGALWHQDGARCLAGDTTQPGTADGSSPRFGRIGAMLDDADRYCLLTEPDLGTLRRVSKTFEATTLMSRNDWSPGALARYRDFFLITDATQNCIWKVDPSGWVRSVMWPEIRWKQPTRIAVYEDNTTFVMDSSAVWKIKNNALEKVCGDYYSSSDSLTSCSQLNLIKMGVFDMAVGAIGTNVTVALLTRFNRLMLLDLNTKSIRLIPATNATAILWPNRLFIVDDRKIIREAGISSCACDDGLYCLQGQCVMAPAGTYASAWKPPAPCPPGSAPNLQGECAPCPMQPAFNTFLPGSLNCIFYGEQSPCGGGMYRQSVLLGGDCAACPLGTYSVGYDCIPYPAGTAGTTACPSAIFDGQFSCRNDTVSDRPQNFQNITDIAVTAGGVVFVATGNALWRTAPVARLCAMRPMDIIAIADDEATFYHTSYGGTVLYRNCVLVREGLPPMKDLATRRDALFIVSIVSGRTYEISTRDYSMRLYTATFASSIASFSSELYFAAGSTFAAGASGANITINGAITSICATNTFIAIATGNRVLVFARSGNMETVLPSSVVSIGCAGRWVWAATESSVRAIQTQSGACLGGYFKSPSTGLCVPVGLGRYTDANGTVFKCTAGYGITDAGASEAAACRECPDGIGGVMCVPCPMFVSKGRCVDECPVPQLQRGACATGAVEKIEKTWETATVVIGLHINAVAASEGCVYYSNMDRLYYLLSDDISFELCRVGATIVSLATNVDGSIVFAIASDGAVYRFPVSKAQSVNVDDTVKNLMTGTWKIATVDGGYNMTLMPNALVVTRRNLTSEMIFLSNLTMKPYKNIFTADKVFSIAGNGSVIVRGNETIAGSMQKSGWKDGLPMVSLLSNAKQIAYDRLTVYVADLNNGLRRIMQVAPSSIKQGTVYQNEPVPFARVLSLQPQEDSSGDWYGFPAPISFSWDDIFRPESLVMYKFLPSKIAPIVTMTNFGGVWAIDRSFMVQPRRIMPGVWFPCNASCQNTVASFAPATTPDQIWHSIRIEAYMNNALTVSGPLDLSIIAGPPRVAMSSQPVLDVQEGTERMGAWSRYIIIGARVLHISNVPDQAPGLRVDSIGWPSHYACTDGYMWLGGGNITCISCLPGTYSARTATKGGPYRCTPCQLGTHSTAVGSTTCLSCPSGTYADTYGATTCASCPESGMWTYPGAQSAGACGFCSPGSANCTKCVAGQYQNRPGQMVCLQCDAGTYSSMSGATACQPCAALTYQPMRGRSACEPCPTATLGGAKVCEPCPQNPHCSLAINAECGRGCGLNKYYDDDKKRCTRCPENTLNAYARCAMDVSACWMKAHNLYYYENANTGVISVMSCQAGYEVTEKKDGCQPSYAGNYANANSSGRCGAGTFSSAIASTACTFCSDGKFSDGGINTVCLACVPGTFSAGVGASACTRCYPGSFSTGVGALSCTHCMQGKWSVSTGRASECDGVCAEGTVSGSGATACMACAAGTYSNQNACVGCGLGFYYFQSRCVRCPPGSANTRWPYASNSSACAPCDDPRFVANAAGDACMRLPPGYVTSSGNAVMCPVGTSRANDELACIPCAAGTWAARPGQSICTPCPVGTFGQRGCIKCPQHTMSDTVAATVCTACAPGSEASTDGTSCIPCPANHYHVMGVGCQVCGANMISPPGSIACTRCPDWTTSPDCRVCPPGQYMDMYENNYYCAACPVGTHNPLHGSRSISDCVTCEARGYVPDASAAGCTPCPPGYSSLNAYECTQCPAGTFSQDGIVCIPCGTGTFSPAPLASQCIQCPAGSRGVTVGLTACTPCPPGTFGVGCETCPIGTFQPNSGAVSCIGRRQRCGDGEYIRVSHASDRDDTCEFCLPCPENSYTVDLNNKEYIGNAKCLGNTTNPPYRCVINDWKAGEYLASSSALERASTGSILTASVRTSLSCDPIDKKKRMRYVVGPTFDCYIGCKYGLNSGGVDKYTAIFVNTKDRPRDNIFLYKNAIAYASQLCAPCPLGQCGLGLYRPVDTEDTACGDPRGCVGVCNEPPANAVTTGGSRELGNRTCPWSCKVGYHLTDDGSRCVSCNDASKCDGNSILLPKTKCDPETRTHQLCRECPYIEGGTPVGWSEGRCVYECAWGYYPPFCSSCQNMTCPVGTYLDSMRCLARKLPPQCVSCTIGSDRATFTSAGAENIDNCMGRCHPGFRPTIENAAAAALKCQPCVDGEPCQGRCPVGSFKNSTTGKCNPCTLSYQCPVGKYAPVCDNAMADPGCHRCPDAPPRNAMFVPNLDYTMDATLLIGAPCAIACQHNHVELLGECVPCSEYWKRTAPYSTAHEYEIFSHWNATPDTTTKSRRSGRCFQCPLGFGVLPGDADLCTILPGFGDSADATSVAPIPSSGEDIYFTYKDPLPSIDLDETRRSLLEAKVSMGSDMIKECPVAYYNDRTSEQCRACPAGTSTYTVGSRSIEDCKCSPGHCAAGEHCEPCPIDTFIGKQDVVCKQCPEGETTFGKSGSTACGCAPGSVRQGAGCVQCAANTFCYPCLDTQPDCYGGVHQFDCFSLGISPPGSTSLKNCTCMTGMTKLKRHMGDPAIASSYYCVRPPPNSVSDGISISCKRGWTSVWEKSQLVACTLCSPGYYYYSSIADDFVGGTCLPCPLGAYTGVSDTIGACTPCPSGSVGKRQAATSVEDGCAVQSMLPEGKCGANAVMLLGTCLCDKGFYTNNTLKCAPCPIGYFSSQVSNTCSKCPDGATTATVGATRRGLCGATEDLCLKPAYAFIGPGMCRRL